MEMYENYSWVGDDPWDDEYIPAEDSEPLDDIADIDDSQFSASLITALASNSTDAVVSSQGEIVSSVTNIGFVKAVSFLVSEYKENPTAHTFKSISDLWSFIVKRLGSDGFWMYERGHVFHLGIHASICQINFYMIPGGIGHPIKQSWFSLEDFMSAIEPFIKNHILLWVYKSESIKSN